MQFTLGNFELFLRAVSGSGRNLPYLRQSTLLLGRIPHIFIVLVVLASLRSSHLKIWTLFLLAFIWRWDGVFGGSDAFFALFPVVPELSASFWSPRWRRVLRHRGLPMPISTGLCGYTHCLALDRVLNNNNNTTMIFMVGVRVVRSIYIHLLPCMGLKPLYLLLRVCAAYLRLACFLVACC